MENKRPEQRVPRFRMEKVWRQWGSLNALQGISLEIEPGERIALIGPSGGGKTTLLNILCGGLVPSQGSFWIDGIELRNCSRAELRRHRRRCGRMEQGGHLLPTLSVHRNVLAGMLAVWPWWKSALSVVWPLETELVLQWLRRVGLESRQWDVAEVLSGGQQQCVAALRALVHQPTVILADEPTASLDPTTSEELIKLLLEESHSRDATLLWSTHGFSLVCEKVERILGLRDGKIFFDLPPDAVTQERLQQLYAGSNERAL